MIDHNTYSKDWIRGIAQQLGKRGDPKLVEKVLYALGLLEQLKQTGLDFIFKGGTSLLLLTDPPRRFSIDIDIIFKGTKEDLEPVLNVVVAMGTFSHWIADNDRKHAMDAPVGHYKLYYTSAFDNQFGEEPILLDVLYSENPYPALVDRPLQHQWLQTSGELPVVRIPAINSILGDKLTAFAPNTIGILYTKNRPAEIIKQLFDVALLFDLASDFNVVRNAYIRNAEEEIKFRKLDVAYQDALADALMAAGRIAERDANHSEFVMLQKGISNIGNYILTPFRIEEAIVCAGKAAYLSRIIATEKVEVVRYTNTAEIADWTIENLSYSKLNKLKKSNPEAFFYWYQALALN